MLEQTAEYTNGYCDPGYDGTLVIDGCYKYGIPQHDPDDTQRKLYSGFGQGDYLDYEWFLDRVVVGGAWASFG